MFYILNIHGSLAGHIGLLTTRGPFPSVEQARIAASNSTLYRHSIVVTGNRAEVIDLMTDQPPLPPAAVAAARSERVAA